MSTSTKILAAFTVATMAGAVLGMLLISPEDSKLAKEIESKKGNGSFIHRLFGSKRNKNFGEQLKQNAEGYEQE